MTRDAWLAAHPYLKPVADVDALVAAAADGIDVPPAPIPIWEDYAEDFRAGVPLLRSARVAIDLSQLEGVVLALIRKLASSSLPAPLAQQCRELQAALERAADVSSATVRPELRVKRRTLPEETADPADTVIVAPGSMREPAPAPAAAEASGLVPPAHAGLFRYLAWAILVRYLSPVVFAFDAWRNEEHWLRNYCPTCGEPPAMAQLVGKDPGRLRKLSCGCCRTRWRYRRTGCPFCDAQDEHRLSVVAVKGEGGLRIDYCETCSGYLKTYDGEGSESVLLADWTSLQLDQVARDRGLKRLAASLYQV